MTEEEKNTNSVLFLNRYWPYQVTVLADHISRRTFGIVKQHQLNLSQWRVLAAVAEEPGRTSVDVVKITPMDKGIVSRATKALLKMGLIRREASQLDGRISHLHMTPRGQEKYASIMPQVRGVLAHCNTQLSTEDLERLSELLQSLIVAFPKSDEP
jgi:DNA-binding MarR family transcriptional regulator